MRWRGRPRPSTLGRVIVSHGSADLATEVTGSGHPDVLLLHAGVTDQRSWQPLRSRLPSRCISFDARGYGRTTYFAEPGWSPVGDALAVLAADDAVPAVVVAASMGGRTAIDLALANPGTVAALVLIAPAISGAPHEELSGVEQEVDRLVEDADERGDTSEVNRLEAWCWLDGPRVPEGRVGGPVRDLFLEMNLAALTATDPGDLTSPVTNAWERLGEIAVPTLVLVGEHDFLQFHDNAREAAARIPDARYVPLPGVAHLPHLEGDEFTLRTIDEFVRSVAD